MSFNSFSKNSQSNDELSNCDLERVYRTSSITLFDLSDEIKFDGIETVGGVSMPTTGNSIYISPLLTI